VAVQFPGLLLLLLDEVLLPVVSQAGLLVVVVLLPGLLDASRFELVSHLVVVVILHVFLEDFDLSLPLHLLIVVRADPIQAFVVVLQAVDGSLAVLQLVLQVDRVTQLLVHEVPLHLLAVGLGPQEFLIVVGVLGDELLVDVADMLLHHIPLVAVVVYYVLKRVVQVELLLVRVLLLKVLQSSLELHVLLHAVPVVQPLGCLQLLVHDLALGRHLQLLPVLLLEVLLALL